MYILDLKNSYINYATQTEKKYFKLALQYAIENKINSVKVNRIKFYFDFNKNQVMIGQSFEKANIYKMKEV